MSSYLFKGIVSSIFLFGLTSYYSYKYLENQRFDDKINKARSEGKLRALLYDIQKKSIVVPANTSLPKENYYRKVLLSYAEGNVLEAGVGLSLNEKLYPSTINKITAVDWVKRYIEHGYLNNRDKRYTYLLDDCEKLSFNDNSFDTIVDVFGLQYYADPVKALKEMKRVCKPEGKILILANGRSFYSIYNKYLDLLYPKYVAEYGVFINRDWDEIIANLGFKIVKKERKVNGTLYFYILCNQK